MTNDTRLRKALETLEIPVSRLKYSGKKTEYIVYQVIYSADATESDDETKNEQTFYRIELFSKTDYTMTLRTLKSELKKAGFYGVEVVDEQYEDDTHLFHVSVECKGMEV